MVITGKPLSWILGLKSCSSVYSSVPNRHACTFISGKVCLLTLIEDKIQTLPEINVHARLIGTLEYAVDETKVKKSSDYIQL